IRDGQVKPIKQSPNPSNLPELYPSDCQRALNKRPFSPPHPNPLPIRGEGTTTLKFHTINVWLYKLTLHF
ncbi:MAG: hypothetical protein Q8O01_04570, partial [Candidatus Omnitrophota bacterium]|nr:hypothetical protein [Candidatus Omnitrophota bacterium]